MGDPGDKGAGLAKMTLGSRAFSKALAASEIESIVQSSLSDILKTVSPQMVILFGSAVCGKFDDASDLDFVVVFEDRYQAAAGMKSLYRMNRSVQKPHDFICVDQDTFQRKSEMGGVLYVAKREGKVLFSRPKI